MERLFEEIVPDKVILNQTALWQLIESLPSFAYPEQEEIIDKLISVASRVLHNPCLMVNRAVMNALISRLLDPLTSESMYQKTSELLQTLIYAVGATRHNTYLVFQTLARPGVTLETVRRALRLLMIISAPVDETSPYNYFYFSGPGSGLVVDTHHSPPYPFLSCFGCLCLLRIEKSDAISRLFVFHSQGHGGVEAYFIGNKLFYHALGPDYLGLFEGNGRLLCEVPYNQWNMLGICHEKPLFGKSHLRVSLNGEEVLNKSEDFPRMKPCAMTYAGICMDFLGQIASATFFNEHVKTLSATPSNEKLCMFYHPMRSQHRVVYEARHSFDATLIGISGAKQWMAQGAMHFSCLIPIVKMCNGPMLEEWLRLLIISMKDNLPNQQELLKSGFFLLVAEELIDMSVISFNHVFLIEELSSHLNEELVAELVVHLGWPLILKTSEEVQYEICELVVSLYKKHTEKIYKALNFHYVACAIVHSDMTNVNSIAKVCEILQIGIMKMKDPNDLSTLINILFARPAAAITQGMLEIIYCLLKDSAFVRVYTELNGLEMLIHILASYVSIEIRELCLQCIDLIYHSHFRHSLLGNPKEVQGFISCMLFPQYPGDPEHFENGNKSELQKYEEVIDESEENGYFYSLNSVLGRPPGCLDMVDDTECIKDFESIDYFLDFLTKSSLHIKYRGLQDMLMLTKWNRSNALVLMRHEHWHRWCLNLLLDIPGNLETTEAIIDTGSRVLAAVMKVAIIHVDDGWKRIQESMKWIKENSSNERSSLVIHCYLTQLVHEIQSEKSCPWKNLVLTCYTLERHQALFSTKIMNDMCEILERNSQNFNKIQNHILKIAAYAADLQADDHHKVAVIEEEKNRLKKHFHWSRMSQLKVWTRPWAHSSGYEFELVTNPCPLLKMRKQRTYQSAYKPEVKVDAQQLWSDIKVQSAELSEDEDEADSDSLPSSYLAADSPLAAVLAKETVSVEVGRVLPLTVRYGLLQIIDTQKPPKIRFIYDERKKSQFTSKVELFEYRPQASKPHSKEWNLKKLINVIPKSYVMRQRAAEFIFNDGKSIMFNFASSLERTLFANYLRKHTKNAVPRSLFFKNPSPIKMCAESDLTEKWVNWKISNFDYLIHLNKMAGRSFNDFTQYPVFPWILSDYHSKNIDLNDTDSYRDLSKNMGSVGTQERMAQFLERYESLRLSEDPPPFHFGSHYSNPVIVLNFLLRQYPYSEGAKELQGGKFDLPDRLFIGIASAFKSASEDQTDLRELIPEFFSCPEFLLNRSKLDLGVTQNGEEVSDVKLPDWSRDAYEFIRLNRQALESDYVSSHLHQWIDLIFGYQQSGVEAEKANNVFHYMTYENSIDLDKIEDPDLRSALESQVVYFGKTPCKLFSKPHPPRESKTNAWPGPLVLSQEASLKYYIPKSRNSEQSQKPILKVRMIRDKEVYCVRKNGHLVKYNWLPMPTGDSHAPFTCNYFKDIPLFTKDDALEALDRSLNLYNFPLYISSSGKLVVQGGFWDGSLCFNKLGAKVTHCRQKQHMTTVVCLSVNDEETLAVTGDKDGEVIVWETKSDWHLLWHYWDHHKKVTAVGISSELHCFGSCSTDGTVNLYSSRSGKLLRTITCGVSLANLMFGDAPPAKVVLFSKKLKMLECYSINGDPLCQVQESCEYIISPVVIKDPEFHEFFIYGTENGDIIIRKTENLELFKVLTLTGSAAVISIVITPDQRYLLAGCTQGDITILTDPESTFALMKRQWHLSSVFNIL